MTHVDALCPFVIEQLLWIEIRNQPDNLVLQLFEWNLKVVIEADILLAPRLRPEARLLLELSPLLKESVDPLLVFLFWFLSWSKTMALRFPMW